MLASSSGPPVQVSEREGTNDLSSGSSTPRYESAREISEGDRDPPIELSGETEDLVANVCISVLSVIR